jgi:hypothetical protein
LHQLSECLPLRLHCATIRLHLRQSPHLSTGILLSIDNTRPFAKCTQILLRPPQIITEGIQLLPEEPHCTPGSGQLDALTIGNQLLPQEVCSGGDLLRIARAHPNGNKVGTQGRPRNPKVG